MASHRRALVAFAAGVVAAGCGLFRTTPSDAPGEPLQVELAAGDRLNPDERGESLPTVVHLYQLKSAAKLEAADYERFYRAANETLGADLLQAQEFTLLPGGKLRRRVERERAAKVLAVVALFRRPTGDSWRTFVELPPPSSGAELRFVAEGYRIERR